MKLKIIFFILGLAIAAGSIWYILNGGKDQTTTEANDSSAQSQATQGAESPQDSLQTVVKNQKDVKIFNELLVASGVAQSLQAAGPYTVLAPTDAAFKALPDGFLDTLKKPENKDKLAAIINYHIIKGTLASNALQNGQKLPTVSGKEVIVEVKDGKTYFIDMKSNKARTVTVDANASNGTVHTISAVLLPQ